ncbi:hypothetical protein ACFV6Y_39305 [Streptomyces massasporeus]|uniref:hypothetical protein n=1 Tax=Streptomyces massasporeus TaxID=67324 RepID=UPI0036638F66
MTNSVHEWPAGVDVRGHVSSDICPCGPTLKPETARTEFPAYVHHDLTPERPR